MKRRNHRNLNLRLMVRWIGGVLFFLSGQSSLAEDERLVRAEITSLELQIVSGQENVLQTMSPALPLSLNIQKNQMEWEFSIFLRSSAVQLTLLYEKSVLEMIDQRANIQIKLKPGENTKRITAIDGAGRTFEYNLVVEVTPQFSRKNLPTDDGIEKKDTPPSPLGNQFLVLGPYYSLRTIHKSGTALLGSSSASGTIGGVKGVYRRRIFSGATDRLPWSIRSFFDGTMSVGTTFGGDALAQGTPIWGEGRFIFDFYSSKKIRIEAGIGVSYYHPGLELSSAGDMEEFFGISFSARAAYSVSPRMILFFGGNIATPAASVTDRSILNSIQREAFTAVSFATFPRQFLEIRLRYYEVSTKGVVVNLGDFKRKETYVGPELFWVFNF
jgi:hypothetical protein